MPMTAPLHFHEIIAAAVVLIATKRELSADKKPCILGLYATTNLVRYLLEGTVTHLTPLTWTEKSASYVRNDNRWVELCTSDGKVYIAIDTAASLIEFADKPMQDPARRVMVTIRE